MDGNEGQGHRPSMLERLINVLGTSCPEPPRLANISTYNKLGRICGSMYDSRYKNSSLEQIRLSDEYKQALQDYLESVESLQNNNQPHNNNQQIPLFNPFLYFYSNRKRIYTVEAFPYGKNRKSVFITQKTFPSFIKNVCQIPYVHGERADCLYKALYHLIVEFPYDQFGSICEQLKRIDFHCFIFLQYLSQNLVISEQSAQANIFYYNDKLSAIHYKSILSIPIQSKVPDRLIKQFFYALLKENSFHSGLPVLDGHQRSAEENIFSDKSRNPMHTVRYSIDEDKFVVCPIPESDILRNIVPKHLPLAKNKTIQWVPEGAFFFLQHMCGTDLGLIDQFSMFLSQVFSPIESGLTVLLSPKNNDILKSSLEKILDISLVKKEGQPWSLNRLSKKQHLKTLFLKQTDGASALLATAAPVSPANIPILSKLSKGKPISIVTSQFPPQHFKNTLHIICITSDRKKAMDLHDVMKARVIDFSVLETKIKTPFDLSEFDLQWLRTTFLLHGLKLRTLNGTDKNVASKHAKKETAGGSFEDSLSTFLEDYCRVESGYFCSTDEIYESYTAFIAAAHGVLTPPVTKRVFNKQLRALLNKQARYKTVLYKRNHVSRTSPSLWGYDGLRPFTCIQPTTPPQVPTQEQRLQEYLLEMSSYEISFDGFMSVELRRGKNDPV